MPALAASRFSKPVLGEPRMLQATPATSGGTNSGSIPTLAMKPLQGVLVRTTTQAKDRPITTATSVPPPHAISEFVKRRADIGVGYDREEIADGQVGQVIALDDRICRRQRPDQQHRGWIQDQKAEDGDQHRRPSGWQPAPFGMPAGCRDGQACGLCIQLSNPPRTHRPQPRPGIGSGTCGLVVSHDAPASATKNRRRDRPAIMGQAPPVTGVCWHRAGSAHNRPNDDQDFVGSASFAGFGCDASCRYATLGCSCRALLPCRRPCWPCRRGLGIRLVSGVLRRICRRVTFVAVLVGPRLSLSSSWPFSWRQWFLVPGADGVQPGLC